jgi:hypothetical protein
MHSSNLYIRSSVKSDQYQTSLVVDVDCVNARSQAFLIPVFLCAPRQSAVTRLFL